MKKLFFTACLGMITVGMQAQETYEVAELATEDLNGTARYVGMGGAMEALGADISTMGTNPAGIGLFRRSWIGVSAGATIQKGDSYNTSVYTDNGKTNADLNQAGVVFSMQTNENSFLNFGFNFQKSRNFNQILNAMGELGNSSVSEKAVLAMNSNTWQYNNMDYLVYDNYSEHHLAYDEADRQKVKHMPYGTQFFGMNDNQGYISEFDFNISGNIKNKLFLGLTIGAKSVDFSSIANYYEFVSYNLARGLNFDPTGDAGGDYAKITAKYPYALETVNERKITGSGVNVKFGAIWRPIETSPFRVGLYIHTPTWYRITQDILPYTYTDSNPNDTKTYRKEGDGFSDYRYLNPLVFEYRFSTPWKFGVSFGHTIGNIVALGLTYDYAKYSAINTKFDRYDDDNVVNVNTKASLKGVHTLKLGAEIKPVPDVAIRVGYNYVSPMYDKTEGYKNYEEHTHGIYECGANFTSNDYTNWGGTNRITFGLGFTVAKHFNIDVAYQYIGQKGEYQPFATTSGRMYNPGEKDTPTGEIKENGTVMQEVKNNRHQLNCTLSYKF